MVGRDKTKQRGSHPFSSGGGGVVLEHRYGAVLLSHLLTGDVISELGRDTEPIRVKFQAADDSAVDDFLVVGRNEVQVSISARRSPKLIASDEESVSLIQPFLKVILENWADISRRRWRLCLATSSPCPAAQQLRELHLIAGSTLSEAAFRDAVDFPKRTNRAVRDRLQQIDGIVVKAAADLAANVPAPELTWRLLTALQVRELRLDGGDEADRAAAVNRLRPITREQSNVSAEALFSKLVDLVDDYAPTRSDINERTLRIALGDLVGSYAVTGAPPPDLREQGAAVLRGPMAFLGLDAAFAQAEETVASNPAAAASQFRSIADTLLTTSFARYAGEVRRRQASAVQAAGDFAARVGVDLDSMAEDLDTGDPGHAVMIIHRLGAEQPDAPDEVLRSVNALGMLAAFEFDHRVSLDEVAATFDNTQTGDPYRLQAATLFAEHAVASRAPELVRARATALQTIADDPSSDPVRQARLRACLADVGHPGVPWSALAAGARALPDPVPSLVFARYGRHLAWSGDPHGAIERYTTAIELALRGERYADAADWLEAQRLVRVRYGVDRDTIPTSHLMAQTLRGAGNGTFLQGPKPPRERALAGMVDDQRLPDTLQSLRLYRWQSVVTGAWQKEQEAEEFLGRFQIRTGQARAAFEHLVAAGASDQLKGMAEKLPDQSLDYEVPADFVGKPQWERASAYILAGEAADLLPDEQAQRWIDTALNEITEDIPSPIGTQDCVQAAYTALATLTWAATLQQSERFLQMAAPLLDGRNPATFKRSDQAHAYVLAAIADCHPLLRHAAVEQMCQALTGRAGLMTTTIIRSPALRSEADLVAELCGPAARQGNAAAALALVVSGGGRSDAETVARTLTKHVIDGITPSSIDSLNLSAIALIAGVLPVKERRRFAEKLSAIVRDHGLLAIQRQEALDGLAALAANLDHRGRARHYSTALAAAQGRLDGSEGDDDAIKHPHDRSGIDWGDTTLRYEGTTAAAMLAHTPDQTDEVIRLALTQLPRADEAGTAIITKALEMLAPDPATLSVPVLAAHSSHWIRRLAASMWCAASDPKPEVGESLATDPSYWVRQVMAQGMPATKDYAGLRSDLAQDPRRSVRRRIDGSASS